MTVKISRAMARRVYQWVYRNPIRRVSGPVQAVIFSHIDVNRFAEAAWGCKGLDPLRSSTPCPIAFPWLPLDTSRATDARKDSLSRWGKGFAPAPLPVFGLIRPRPALRRDGGGKLPIRIKHRIVFLEPSTLATSTKGGDVVLVFLVRLNRAAFYPVSPPRL